MIWAVVLIISIIIEIFTFQLVSIWFAIGSLFAFISSFVFGFPVQLAIFIVSSAIMLIFTRPILRTYIKTDFKPTNHELNIGKIATVTETIDNANQTGRVSLDGVEWTAITETFEPIEVGSHVVVLDVEGAKLLVAKN